MSQESQRKLLDFLGYQPPIPGAALEAAPPEFIRGSIDQLSQWLEEDTERVLAAARSVLPGDVTKAELTLMLARAAIAMDGAEATLAHLEANRDDQAFELPPSFRFEGYDPPIPILRDRTQFETVADAPAWAVQSSISVFEALFIDRPDFRFHSSGTSFDYALAERNGETTLALFSDWGTGYYHSRYIARHIIALEPAQAAHLGDVYYAGRAREFEEFFAPILEPLIQSTPFYALNANHEMMSRGRPYFDFLDEKRRRGGVNGRVVQPQEASYFCLQNDHYQILGLDTAFHANGRHRDPTLQQWLSERLARGRALSKVNILLSQNEPYGPSRFGAAAARDLLAADLAGVKDAIDLWFWGDEHYAALYRPSPIAPFFGSCIGHGGYPYTLKEGAGEVDSGVGAEVAWVETEPRFPKALGWRPKRGNNGFGFLTLEPDHIELEYIDWRRRSRRTFRLPVAGGRITGLQDLSGGTT